MAAYNLDDAVLVIPKIRELAPAGVQAESNETVSRQHNTRISGNLATKMTFTFGGST